MSSSKWFAIVVFAGILLVFVSSAAAIVGIPDENQSSATSAAGFIMITPAGTGPSLGDQGLTISVTILDAGAIPIPNYPFQDIWWGRDGAGTLSSCPGGCSADANTDASGETTISGAACAGGWALGGLRVFVAGTPIIGTPALEIEVNSPDLDGNRAVDLADLGDFAIDYHDPTYNFRSDITGDGIEDIADVGEFAIHYGEACP
jgi:uncharacterized membrane protein